MLILIAENEVLISLALQITLEAAGHRVLGPVNSGKEALRLAEAGKPQLAFVNTRLRGGESGIRLAGELLAHCGVPSLAVTGSMPEVRDGKGIILGYLQIPYDPVTVVDSVEVIEQILCGSPPAKLPEGLELFTMPVAAVA